MYVVLWCMCVHRMAECILSSLLPRGRKSITSGTSSNRVVRTRGHWTFRDREKSPEILARFPLDRSQSLAA